jgi:hypothetical protein
MKLGIFLLILILIVMACSNDSSSNLSIQNPKIKAALENRKADYAAEIMRTCQQDMLLKAEAYVDSLISADVDFRINDSIVFPPKPLKPEWPGAIIVPDSNKAKPLFKVKKN